MYVQITKWLFSDCAIISIYNYLMQDIRTYIHMYVGYVRVLQFLYLPQNLPKYIDEARKPAYRPAQNNKSL